MSAKQNSPKATSPLAKSPESDTVIAPSPQHTTSSGSSATVKVSSPLNPSPSSPSTTPKKKPIALPDPESTPSPIPNLAPTTSHSPPSAFTRRRGHSTSTIREDDDAAEADKRSPSASSITIAELSRTTSAPLPPPTVAATNLRSFSFRSRSPASTYRDRSPGPIDLKVSASGTETPPGGLSQSWWSRTEDLVVARPWRDHQKKKTIPPEQTEGWMSTRARVAEAAASVLGTAGDVAHEALLLSVDVLRFAPVIGLEEAARTLLNIWDSLQMVDMNRLACLRLTERCADILLSVREEVAEAGDQVGQELHIPILKLVDSFTQVHAFLQRQLHRPFLKRYLKRDEILRQIVACDKALSDSLEMFSLKIQIRILKQVQRQQAMMNAMMGMASGQAPALPSPAPGNALQLTGVPEHPSKDEDDTTPLISSLALSLATASPAQIRSTLRALHDHQNLQDQEYDMVDLRQLMRTALQTNSDADMINVLQVGRDEMPEAIKTLQRALEREVEREGEERGHTESVVDLRVMSRGSIGVGGFVRPAGLVRRLTGSFVGSSAGTARDLSVSSASSVGVKARDTLDREFIESGIDALRRFTKGGDMTLPPWTITRYEVDREEKIGIGFFSDVYRGTWRHFTVAIKVLAPTTPRKLFVNEIEIWKSLKHPNVLELFGASSAAGDPPWFFVSPYCANGSLVTYLKNAATLDEVDLLKAMHEVSKGMAYLHGRGVLHGDLKAANVLVDDRDHCLVSDFGQSEMKSEVARISGTPPPHGTLRWQAPELLEGLNQLSIEVDVYAYAICCVEILTKGALPWPMLDDTSVSRLVLEENRRPSIPLTHVSSDALTRLLQLCWNRDPSKRPHFSAIEREMKLLRIRSGSFREDSPWQPQPMDLWDEHGTRPSPDIRPDPLPDTIPVDNTGTSSSSNDSYVTASNSIIHSPARETHIPRRAVASEPIAMPIPTLYTPSTNNSSTSSLTTPDSRSSTTPYAFPGFESPPPINETTAECRNERRYRMLLSHTFHRSLILPLWAPGPVVVGAVGYLSKPKGQFITLFNALDPSKSSKGDVKGMASVYGYGRVSVGRQDQDKRTPMQKGFDAIHGLFKNQNLSRRYSFDLRAGHRVAYLCTEKTTYNFIENLDAPKKWFKSNIDAIMRLYGPTHRIQREDVFLVIGTLDTPEYALFVSHSPPDAQAHFDVFSPQRSGQPWGKFSIDNDVSSEVGGPVYAEEITSLENAPFESKVSTIGAAKNRGDTVLLARLRFKPDALEPTSL